MIRQIRLILKYMTLQSGRKAVAICILPNISRSKHIQTIKCGQLTEYNLINIFYKKSYTNCAGETIPRFFSKKSNWAYFSINSLKIYMVCFYCMPSWSIIKHFEISCKPLPFTSCKTFLRTKERTENSCPVSFSAWFLKKNVSFVVFY